MVLMLMFSACKNTSTITAPPIQNLTDLFDKKWIFQYAIENGKKTMEYQQIIDKVIWINLSSQLHSEQPCENIFSESTIPNDGRCFYGYDGCNEFWGIYTITENGEFEILERYSESLGCPIQITTQINPNTQESEFILGSEIYNSDPFTKTFSSTVNFEVNSGELKLYYPSAQQNYLLFQLEENQ